MKKSFKCFAQDCRHEIDSDGQQGTRISGGILPFGEFGIDLADESYARDIFDSQWFTITIEHLSKDDRCARAQSALGNADRAQLAAAEKALRHQVTDGTPPKIEKRPMDALCIHCPRDSRLPVTHSVALGKEVVANGCEFHAYRELRRCKMALDGLAGDGAGGAA